VVPG
jgi:hypothetical protein